MGRPKGSKNKNPIPLNIRFWKKVSIPDIDGCWEWKAYVHPSGYGNIACNRKMRGAHRVSWEIHYGSIPEGMLVCHTCDNKKCVNPDHLFLGTYQDNAKDMINKGRGMQPDNKGEKHGRSKLIESDVLEIRRLYASGEYTQQDIADRFGIVRQSVSRIVLRKQWKWLE